jgi:hypothetical protein
VNGKQDAVNPKHQGTKAAAHCKFEIDPGKTAMIRLRLRDKAPTAMGDAFKNFADIVQTRRTEADDFYQATTPGRVGEDEARVMRQALAGMLWSKQYFGFDVDKWLLEHGVDPMNPNAKQIRNVDEKLDFKKVRGCDRATNFILSRAILEKGQNPPSTTSCDCSHR